MVRINRKKAVVLLSDVCRPGVIVSTGRAIVKAQSRGWSVQADGRWNPPGGWLLFDLHNTQTTVIRVVEGFKHGGKQ